MVGGPSLRFLHRWERGCSSPWKQEGQEVWRVDTILADEELLRGASFSSSSIPRATCCGYTTSMWLQVAGQDKRNSRDPVPALIPASISKRFAFRCEGKGRGGGERSSSFSIVESREEFHFVIRFWFRSKGDLIEGDSVLKFILLSMFFFFF